ncbi:MAG TPA: peptide chain release factor N(5)-glutamine methyltransferase [Thermoanaerobaculaceae bacterium]|nr:peptide chain release factor N(5)-glutamine methyltransferase [Thermoanaerobaculaceae bacterium]HRS17495.1 peptide chain release factor N(5)-glutamine methyltransferase [Thermoanaerobaculaceae bacterium]
MTVGELLAEAAEVLPRREGLPDPGREARWLLARVLERSEAWLWAHPEEEVDATAADRFRAWVAERAAGQPAHYVVGTCPFWGRGFEVAPGVLIPRPETELVVERILRLPLPRQPRVLDVGTGSGCLAVTLALELPGASVTATEISAAAIAVARANAIRLGGRVRFVLCDLASPLAGEFDLVVANLPYVPAGQLAGLAPELAWEPRLALVGGADGTELLQRLLCDLPRLVAAGGFVVLEHGEGQADLLAPLLPRLGLRELVRQRDISGRDRVLVVRREPSA